VCWGWSGDRLAGGCKGRKCALRPSFCCQNLHHGRSGKHFQIRRTTIAEVAAGLRSGAIATSEIQVGVVNIGGQLVTVNNRSLTALTRAGLRPTNILDMSGDAVTVRETLGRLAEMGGAPSATIRIRGIGRGASAIYQ
jgi:hypothetical protein